MMVGAYAMLCLDAIQHNLGVVRHHAPNAKIMAVIKANGYGHGLLSMARALTGVDAFAVARIDEAIRLRQAGFSQDITVLEGFSTEDELNALLAYGLTTVVHNMEQITLLQNRAEKDQLKVWFKIDSGMNRLGFKAKQVASAYTQLSQLSIIKPPIGLMTHLASADNLQDGFTAHQIALFNQLTAHYQGPRSIANSAGLLGKHDAITDWVRPGLMLYGISPFLEQTGTTLGLRPVMSLHSHLIAIKAVEKGETVGYSGSWRCQQDTLIGIAAIGYGDGYPRHTQVRTPVLVNGQRAPLIGKVSMDMITINLKTQPHAKPGDPVILWGKELPIEEIAQHAETIPYTLVCGITQRVQFITA